MSFKASLIALALAVLTCAASAEEARLTLDEAHALARRNNPTVRAAAEGIVSALAQRGEAHAARLPQVTLSGRYARLSSVPDASISVPIPGAPPQITISPTLLNQYALDAVVNAPIFTGFRLENAERAAEHVARAAQNMRKAVEAKVTFAVDRAYWQLYSARAALRALAESVRLVERYLDDVQRMRTVGMATDEDVLGVQVRLSEARLRLVQAEHGAKLAEAQLATLLSLPLATEIVLIDSPTVIARPLPDADSLQEIALARRPELRALEERYDAAMRRAAAEHGAKLPNVALQATYELARPNPRYFPTEDVWHDTWNVGVGMTWTAWDWGLVSHRTRRAEAEARQVREELRRLREQIALEAAESSMAFAEATRRVELAKEAVAHAEEHFRGLRARFDAGTASTTDVLDAEVALERAQLQLIRALADQQIAWARMEYATGGPLR